MIPDQERRIVIVGGGFAGTTLARALEQRLDDTWDVFLLTRTNVLTYNPLLPEVVGGGLLPGHVAAPIRLMLKRARIRTVTVERLDIPNREVHYSGAACDSLRFDHLVFAMGMAARVDAVPGMAEHALPLKTLGDALHLRNTVLWRLEQATLTRDPVLRRHLMTFVVIGGGFSGVESAGEIFDLVTSSCRYYRNVERSELRVVVLHSGDRLLPEVSVGLSEYVHQQLTARGVEVRLQSRAAQITGQKVVLAGGESVEAATVVSTVGTTPHEFIRDSALETENGRIVTDETLRISGTDNLWAIGDCASVRNGFDGQRCPPTAQFAVHQARHLVNNLLATIKGTPILRFSYRPLGQLAAIGHHNAIAEIRGVRLRGWLGWLLWRGVYLLKIPTLAAKARVFFEWSWAMVFPRDTGLLNFERSRGLETNSVSNTAEGATSDRLQP